MYQIALALAICFTTPWVLAGQASGKIISIEVSNNDYAVMFQLSSQIKGTPRCNESSRFSIDLRKPSGMAAYTSLLEAKREQYTVSVEGLNTCANEWKSEDSKSITLE